MSGPPKESDNEPCANTQLLADRKHRTFPRFALGLILGLCLGLGGGFLWKSRIQDARFVSFQAQMKLYFDLEAADLAAAYGRPDDARARYQRLLKTVPQWPDALERYSGFLHAQCEKLREGGALAQAVEDAQESLTIAQRFYDLDKSQPRAQHVLKIAHDQVGDCLLQTGSSSRDVRVFEHRQRSLELAEVLLKADPKSAQAARDTLASLYRIGDLMAQRDEPSDLETVLHYFTQSLEITKKLLAANPTSAQRVFEVVEAHQHLASLYLQQGDKAGEERHSRANYELLHERVAGGETLDPASQRAHEELHARFGK